MKLGSKRVPRRATGHFFPEGRRTIILGTGPLARQIVDAIKDYGRGDYQLVGAIGESGPIPIDDQIAGCEILGSVRQLESLLAAYDPDCVIVAVAGGKLEIMERLLLFLLQSDASIVPGVDVYEELTGQVPIDTLTPDDFVFGQEVRPGVFAIYVNRLISLLLAAIGIVLTIPVMALIALAVRFDSEGPAIYRQDRAGLHGRRFRLFKFRTMRVDSSVCSVWAAENTERITRVGEWLRKFRLDELPQLFNVLMGHMNLVGPRPHPSPSSELVDLISRNVAECGVAMPYYPIRSTVRPGITGWAQVRYKYANGLAEEMEKLRFDLYYIKHYSVWLDLRILMMTLAVIARGRGSGRSIERMSPQGPGEARSTSPLLDMPPRQEEKNSELGGGGVAQTLLTKTNGERRSGVVR